MQWVSGCRHNARFQAISCADKLDVDPVRALFTALDQCIGNCNCRVQVSTGPAAGKCYFHTALSATAASRERDVTPRLSRSTRIYAAMSSDVKD